MRAQDVIGTLIALWFLMMAMGGCAVQVGPCSKYPCEWSKPLVKRPAPPTLDQSEPVRRYLCLEPTRQYPVMPAVNCI